MSKLHLEISLRNGGILIMIYGYARVSTVGQERNGNSLEEQQMKLKEAGCQTIITEQYTGTTTERPKFEKLISELKDGDTLIVTKMDRFARTASKGSEVAKSLLDRGINLHILNMGRVDNTPVGRLTMNMLLAFAEFERDMIVERTQGGRQTARVKNPNYREGRKPIDKAKTDHAVELINNGHTYKEAVNLTGLSKSTIIRAVRRYRAEQQQETQSKAKTL